MAAGDTATEAQHASGAVAQPAASGEQGDTELAYGEAMMPGGRISIAHEVKPGPPQTPFSPSQLARLDEALTLSTRDTGIDFSIYLGSLDDGAGEAGTRAEAEALHASLGAGARNAVLIAVSPEQRKVEIVTGERSARRLPDRSCKLAVMSMVASFKLGDLAGGLMGGLRMLTDQAGPPPRD